jgi:hypothetical protein
VFRTPLLALLVAMLLVACGDARRGGSGQRADTTTPPVLAALTVERSGGVGGRSASLAIGPGDARLARVAEDVPIPLPASAVADDAACADCYVYEVTAVLSDGTAATWRYPQTRPPRPLGALADWIAAVLG